MALFPFLESFHVGASVDALGLQPVMFPAQQPEVPGRVISTSCKRYDMIYLQVPFRVTASSVGTFEGASSPVPQKDLVADLPGDTSRPRHAAAGIRFSDMDRFALSMITILGGVGVPAGPGCLPFFPPRSSSLGGVTFDVFIHQQHEETLETDTLREPAGEQGLHTLELLLEIIVCGELELVLSADPYTLHRFIVLRCRGNAGEFFTPGAGTGNGTPGTELVAPTPGAGSG